MAEGTRGLFFSVACDTGDASIDPRKAAPTAPSAVPNHRKKKRAGGGDGNGNGSDGGKRSFCTTFGRREAWTAAIQKPGVRTEGQCWETRGTIDRGTHVFTYVALSGLRVISD